MSKHKVSELAGLKLDAAIAVAQGWTTDGIWCTDPAWPNDPLRLGPPGEWSSCDYFSPSSLWEDGGPLIEREEIGVHRRNPKLRPTPGQEGPWVATIWRPGFGLVSGSIMTDLHFDGREGVQISRSGATPLEAAMRALVTAKLGEEVELPAAD